jgi:bla regulator protein BlaR1
MKLKLLAVAAILAGFGALVCAGEVGINTVEVDGRLVDDIDLPFVNDPEVLGEWVSVDFVETPRDFRPGMKSFGVALYLKGLTFLPEGKTAMPWFNWTKGVVTHKGDKTAARYIIKEIKGAKYMFFEWKSGDYSIRHQKPQYYVLKKK